MRGSAACVLLFALSGLCACFAPKLSNGAVTDRDAQAPQGVDAATQPIREAGSPYHPACRSGLEAAEPLGPTALSLDPSVQNSWSTLDCVRTPTLLRCDRFETPCPTTSVCIYPEEGALGYCVDYPRQNLAPEDEQEPFAPTSYRVGACVTHLSKEQHAALCCADVPGVDCELWPRTTPSVLGAVCERDEQCEVGLVCVATSQKCPTGQCSYANASFGRCACPEASGGTIGNDPTCSHDSPG